MYGKTTEQLGTIIKAHQVVLGHYDHADIRKAYTEHLENNSTMPAPADIALRIKGYLKHRSEIAKMDSYAKALPAPSKPNRRVPWAFKDWADFTAADKDGLRAHLTTLTDKQRTDYKAYLTNWCNMPKEAI